MVGWGGISTANVVKVFGLPKEKGTLDSSFRAPELEEYRNKTS